MLARDAWTAAPVPVPKRKARNPRRRAIFAKYFLSGRLWKEIINEGLWAGFMLFFLRWCFDFYLALLSGQKPDAGFERKTVAFSKRIHSGRLYLSRRRRALGQLGLDHSLRVVE